MGNLVSTPPAFNDTLKFARVSFLINEHTTGTLAERLEVEVEYRYLVAGRQLGGSQKMKLNDIPAGTLTAAQKTALRAALSALFTAAVAASELAGT